MKSKKILAISAICAGLLALSLTLKKDVNKEKQVVEQNIVYIEKTIPQENQSNQFSTQSPQSSKTWKRVVQEIQTLAKKRAELTNLSEKITKQIAKLENEGYTQEGHIWNLESIKKFEQDDSKTIKILDIIFRFSAGELKLWLERIGPDLYPYERSVPEELFKKFPKDLSRTDLENFTVWTSDSDKEWDSKEQPYLNFVLDIFMELNTEQLEFIKSEKVRLAQFQEINNNLIEIATQIEEVSPDSLSKLYDFRDQLDEYLDELENYIDRIKDNLKHMKSLYK